MRLALFLLIGLAAEPAAAQVTASLDSSRAAPATQAAPLHAQPVHAQSVNAPHPDRGGTDGAQPIPEPSTLLLVGTGLLGVALTARWRRRPSK